MQSLEEKIARVKKVEEEMNQIAEELESTYNYRMNDKLVDSEGYPRGDIDVYNISKLLRKYRELHSEWRPLRKEVEEEVLCRFEK